MSRLYCDHLVPLGESCGACDVSIKPDILERLLGAISDADGCRPNLQSELVYAIVNEIQTLRADLDRLAGEVEKWRATCAERNGIHERKAAVLQAELAEARENEARYLWLRTLAVGVALGNTTIKWSLVFYAPDSDADELFDAAIDAARSAGGEG